MGPVSATVLLARRVFCMRKRARLRQEMDAALEVRARPAAKNFTERPTSPLLSLSYLSFTNPRFLPLLQLYPSSFNIRSAALPSLRQGQACQITLYIERRGPCSDLATTYS
jgi:hypothetical protein